MSDSKLELGVVELRHLTKNEGEEEEERTSAGDESSSADADGISMYTHTSHNPLIYGIHYESEVSIKMSQGRMQSGQISATHSQGDLNRPNNPQSQPMPMMPMVTPNGVQLSQRVFMQRDYSLGVAIRFKTDFPMEFNGRLDPMAFEYTMNQINEQFAEAERFDCGTFCESCLGFLTANIIWWCRDSRYEKALKRITKFIDEQNQRVYVPNGLYITDPIERGLRCVEINILGGDQQHS